MRSAYSATGDQRRLAVHVVGQLDRDAEAA